MIQPSRDRSRSLEHQHRQYISQPNKNGLTFPVPPSFGNSSQRPNDRTKSHIDTFGFEFGSKILPSQICKTLVPRGSHGKKSRVTADLFLIRCSNTTLGVVETDPREIEAGNASSKARASDEVYGRRENEILFFVSHLRDHCFRLAVRLGPFSISRTLRYNMSTKFKR